MWNAGLDEAQTGIKIAKRNINNLRYADDTTLMSESKDSWHSTIFRFAMNRDRKLTQNNIYLEKIIAVTLN